MTTTTTSLPAPAAKPTDWQKRVRTRLPTIFFLGGFVWDTLTLNRGSSALDLWLLFLYNALPALLLVLLGRGVRWPKREHVNWVLQFCYGSTFSALTVLYFTSAGSWTGLVFVAGIAGLLVWNEFLEERYGQFTLALTMLCVSATMWLNFNLPVLTRTVRPLWFYASTALALGLVFGVRKLARLEVGIVPPCVFTGAIVLLFLLGWIPPVPLVKRDMIVCHRLDASGDGRARQYVAQVVAPPFWHFWRRSDALFWPGDTAQCYAAIYLPPRVEADVKHRWYWDDPQRGWTQVSEVQTHVRGGRDDGYRARSSKSALKPGDWYVQAETPNGQIVGRVAFTVADRAPDEAPRWKEVRLR